VPPPFQVKFVEDAGGEVRGLDGSIKQKLKKVLEKKLSVDPEGYGTPLRAELVNYYKHEFADHRIIYRIYQDKKLVVVCAVGPRKRGDTEDVYKQLGKVVASGKLAAQIQEVLKVLLPRSGGAKPRSNRK
jgi:mRNA-degrading endonuclease RelE of RelBE toxin-antitoxin system